MKRILFLLLFFYNYIGLSQTDCESIFLSNNIKFNSSIIHVKTVDILKEISPISKSEYEYEIRFYDEGDAPWGLKYFYRIYCDSGKIKGETYYWEIINDSNYYLSDTILRTNIKIANHTKTESNINFKSLIDSLKKYNFFNLKRQNSTFLISKDTVCNIDNEREIIVRKHKIFGNCGMTHFTFQYKIGNNWRSLIYDYPFVSLKLMPKKIEWINIIKLETLFSQFLKKQ